VKPRTRGIRCNQNRHGNDVKKQNPINGRSCPEKVKPGEAVNGKIATKANENRREERGRGKGVRKTIDKAGKRGRKNRGEGGGGAGEDRYPDLRKGKRGERPGESSEKNETGKVKMGQTKVGLLKRALDE